MFGTWVITLHLPRVLGLYGIVGAPKNPDEWSSLLIAMALWGGFWELALGADVARENSNLETHLNAQKTTREVPA